MIETLSQDSLERVAELIWQADALIVTAGVGMGTRWVFSPGAGAGFGKSSYIRPYILKNKRA